MNHLEYVTCGTCSRLITIDVDAAGIIRNLSFLGGCSGNLKGICALAIGKHRDKEYAQGHHLRQQGHKLSGPACYSLGADGLLTLVLS